MRRRRLAILAIDVGLEDMRQPGTAFDSNAVPVTFARGWDLRVSRVTDPADNSECEARC